ncbi:MAG: alpha-amylase family glycosyl hydrolase, partial [Bradymonadia bacterium]
MGVGLDLECRLRALLVEVYDSQTAERVAHDVCHRLRMHRQKSDQAVKDLDASDVMLITYGDAFSAPGEMPLYTLYRFFTQRLAELISAVHVLPFYPYTSDDGFAVSDYRNVDAELGNWRDIERLSQATELMFDFPLNHASSAHEHFVQFLNNAPPGKDFFVSASPDADVSEVTRPRAHPLLQKFDTAAGSRHVWCTFSRDQVDWDFSNPDVLLMFIDVLLLYLHQGATWLRLDAIAYLWKCLGTT